MYAPRQFREERRDVLLGAIDEIRFGMLALSTPEAPEVVHLPMVVREGSTGLTIEGHVAVGNPFWRLATTGTQALAVFQGPHAYVHPGWYETKRTTGKAVPTWNYVVVHVQGILSVKRDPRWLRRHVEQLTDIMEAQQADPWAVADTPTDYIDAMIGAIVGISLSVERMEGVWKLIQHHPEANRTGVIAGLSATGKSDAQAVAALMAQRESNDL